ncbi:DUF4265 domain-containing protein [Streptomyces sp. NBC_00210]|uniref:DUF4265 domain-containing protein n=1 Tax=Streptomyces sp. NBC_00210 TaxID=2903636 RepID=UPI003245B60D
MSSENSSVTKGGELPSGEAKAEQESKPERLFKVAFDLPEETASWVPASAELLWTGKTSVKMEVQVRNTPFYVKGIAFADIVRVRADHERREFVFEEFVAESGHSTIRIILKDDKVQEVADSLLRSFDCSWEIDSTGYLWAIDVPPIVDYSLLKAELLRIANDGRIGIEEAALSEVHRERPVSPKSDT